MSKITQLNERSIAVEVPEGTKNYHVWGGDKPQLAHEYITKNLIEKEFGDSTKYISLPPGSWSILGRPEEMTREQCDKVMEGYDGSLYTLLTEKNIKPEDSVIILIKQ